VRVARASCHRTTNLGKENDMRVSLRNRAAMLGVAALASGLLLAQGALAQSAQSPPQTREQVRMEFKDFLRSHRWDEATDTWVLKSGFEPPAGVRSRAEVKAERDAFFAANSWNENEGRWVPIKGEPRNVSKLSRAEVRRETAAFLRTHRWDEEKNAWVDQPAARKKP
jgi:hypothetical protein